MAFGTAMLRKAAVSAALLLSLVDGKTTTTKKTTTTSSSMSKRQAATPSSSTSVSTTTIIFSAVVTSTVYGCMCTPTPSTTTISTQTSSGSNTAVTANLSTTVTLTGLTSSTSISSSPSSSTILASASSSSSATSSASASSSSTSAATVTSASPSTFSTIGTVNGNNFKSSTATSSSASASATPSAGRTVSNTILVLARNSDEANTAKAGLDGYGIPYQVLLVPQGGVTLPPLNSSATQGNYGGFITLSELSYQSSSGGYASVVTDAQWNTLYAYQKAFGVRMVRLDVYPWTSAFGAEPIGGCCGSTQEQLVSFSNNTGFPGANIKLGAGMSTMGLYHYPSTVTDPSTTVEIAQFAPDSNSQFSGTTTAAVINNFNGRQQMVFFMAWGTQFSATSALLQHGYIHWMTRGLFVGSRKSYFLPQVDDVHLRTQLYSPAGQFYRSVPQDYKMHATWLSGLNSRLPAGSNVWVELAHNGNGDIIAATNGSNNNLCNPNTAIYYPAPATTDLEFQKPLGTGTSVWPTSPANYTWSVACAATDALASWFMVPSNRDAFSHLSHTFTHLNQDNATFADVNQEIFFNQQWLSQIGLANGRFSPNGLVPPAITGMHNGDALQAWAQNGITGVVGDNSRPVLTNQQNAYWPLVTTVGSNGYAGMTVMPRWDTSIYYDCSTPDCTTQEWTNLWQGTGSFTDLLTMERNTNTRYLYSLRHDPYMFHQANLRAHDAATTTVGSQTGQFGLMQIWIETITQEMSRTTNWPLLTLKHDDMVQQFVQRMTRDQCQPTLSWTYSTDGKSITGAQVGTANGNSCAAPIGVTLPGPASTTSGATSDQVGSEPLINWVNLSGSPVTFTLNTPISVL